MKAQSFLGRIFLVGGLIVSFPVFSDDTCSESVACQDESPEFKPSLLSQFNKSVPKKSAKRKGAIVSHVQWDEILKKYVKDGWVNYRALHKTWKRANHPVKLYLKELEKPTRRQVESWSREDQMAFYINAYNAYTIKLILDNYPVKSIKKINKGFFGTGKGPWKVKLVKLMGEVHDLDWIEHSVLRPVFKDARVHAAINCASKGCPTLQSYAFVGSKLKKQLEEVMREFVNDPVRNAYDSDGKIFYISSIFKWFKNDFKPDVKSFMLKYADDRVAEILHDRNVEWEYEYDWTLNEK